MSGCMLLMLALIWAQVSGLASTVADLKTGLAVAKSQIEARLASMERRVTILEDESAREEEARRKRLEKYNEAMDTWQEHERRARAERR